MSAEWCMAEDQLKIIEGIESFIRNIQFLFLLSSSG